MLETPPDLFNALFLTKHAQGHFLTEGIPLRHLCDWAILLKERVSLSIGRCFIEFVKNTA